MRALRIHEAATDEAAEAAAWYEKERPGLGTEFEHAVDAALDLLEEDIVPLMSMPGAAGRRGVKRLICRGERARKAVPTAAVQAPEDAQVIAARARSAWARLIHKVYEVDPLECPRCGAPMHVIALIDDANPRTSGSLGAAPGATESARATEGRKGHRRIKTAGARTDPPSRSRHRLTC